MKNLSVLFLATISFIFSRAQEKPEDNFNVELNVIGLSLNYEKAIIDNFTVNGQVGYVGGLFKGVTKDVLYIFTPAIEVEPRIYYNFSKRAEKGKNVSNNSANYFSLGLNYIPGLLTSGNEREIEADQSFNVIPRYGLRRSIKGGFSFDFAIGAGYQWNKDVANGFVPDLELGISYSF